MTLFGLALADLSWAPLVPVQVLLAAAGIFALLMLLGVWRGLAASAGRRFAFGLLGRAVAAAILLLVLANPSLVVEEREGLDDIAVVLLDDSPSQTLAEREASREAARDFLATRLGAMRGLETRFVNLSDVAGDQREGTNLVSGLRNVLSGVPGDQFAGAIVITDGQAHDADERIDAALAGAPLHVWLTGSRDDRDRRLVVEKAPRFGVVGRPLEIEIRIEDSTAEEGTPLTLSIYEDGEYIRRETVPANRTTTLEHAPARPGENIVELEIEAGEAELTLDNNRAILPITGVRDRLRVLLVSGQPYAGERAWRNLLKSDPAVDLIHFTILRPPLKDDYAPVNELSLIVFPTRELFLEKLHEFDLVVFDRYSISSILPNGYLENVNDYVRNGGALLLAAGPQFVTGLSLYNTPLRDILPAAPGEASNDGGFRPRLTETGLRHPVTAGLPGANTNSAETPDWGRWFRQIDIQPGRGDTILAGDGEAPLMVLDRVGAGRVAMVLSDHIWLWGRGIDGGGPQGELVRRLGHWLMQEPDLEEERLSVSVRGSTFVIERRTLGDVFPPVVATAPSGAEISAEMRETAPGRAVAEIEAAETGLYRFSNGAVSALAAIGSLNPVEMSSVVGTASKLMPLVDANGGAMLWHEETPEPGLRQISGQGRFAGASWFGLRRNEAFRVTGIAVIPLLPALLVALLALAAQLIAWEREGR